MNKQFRLFATIGLLSVFTLLSFKADKKIIVIDAGHGGHDFGGKIESHYEKDIVNEIAQNIKNLNASQNVEIVLLRDGDKFITLEDRVKAINNLKPDLLISLHVDQAIDKSATGVNALVGENNFYDTSVGVADRLLDNISNENLKRGTTKPGSMYIIKNSQCPSLNLQLGNLSNMFERQYITSKNGQDAIARNILKTLAEQ